MKIEPLHPLFAARVTGIDLRRPADSGAVQEITAALDEHAILIFPGQQLTDAEQLAFSGQFGPLEVTVTPSPRVGSPSISDVSNLDAENRVLDPDDSRRWNALGNMLWHTDSSFKPIPAMYSMLSARVVTAAGGETEFADMRAAYDALPASMKDRIKGLSAAHSLAHSRAVIGFDMAAAGKAVAQPIVHPLVKPHPGSGRRTLFLASHASHVIGWPVPEGRILLMQLIEFATQHRFVYRHSWNVGDLVIWDNRCTMHRALPYDAALPRDLRRTTVECVQ